MEYKPEAYDAKTFLAVEIGYFPMWDSYGIVVADWEVNLSTEMTKHSVNRDLSQKYQITPASKLHINPEGKLPFRLLQGTEYEESHLWSVRNVSLAFLAQDFDESAIKRFLEVSFLMSIYLRKNDGRSLTALIHKENQIKIMRDIRDPSYAKREEDERIRVERLAQSRKHYLSSAFPELVVGESVLDMHDYVSIPIHRFERKGDNTKSSYISIDFSYDGVIKVTGGFRGSTTLKLSEWENDPEIQAKALRKAFAHPSTMIYKTGSGYRDGPGLSDIS